MYVEDAEIADYMKTAGLLLPIHKGVVRAHFNMDETSDSVILDQAGNGYHGNLMGGASFVAVSDVFDGSWSAIVKNCSYHGILVAKMTSPRNLLRLDRMTLWATKAWQILTDMSSRLVIKRRTVTSRHHESRESLWWLSKSGISRSMIYD